MWFLISPIISTSYFRNYYKSNPTNEVYSDYFEEGKLCSKCEIGKIKYSKLFDGHGNCYSDEYSGERELFICFDCKIVYPETYAYYSNKSELF